MPFLVFDPDSDLTKNQNFIQIRKNFRALGDRENRRKFVFLNYPDPVYPPFFRSVILKKA